MNKKSIIQLVIISALSITIFSCSSVLYSINPWSDANMFLTIGRSMLDGKLLYTQVFDHKGPLLYLIYIVAAVISNDSFFGVYIIEIVSLFFFLFFVKKTINLFTDNCNPIFYILIAFAICSCSAFSFGGGSVEEFSLPLISICMYIVLKVIIQNKNFSIFDCISLGTVIAIEFLMKFTLCSVYVGLVLTVILYQYKVDRSRVIPSFISALAPFLVLNIIVYLAFVITKTSNEYISTYFIFNIFGYSANGASFISRISSMLVALLWYWKNNILMLSLSFLGLLGMIIITKNQWVKLLLLSTAISWYFLTFWFGIHITYYTLPIAVYITYVPLIVNKVKQKRVVSYVMLMLCVGAVFLSQNLSRIGNKNTIQKQIVDQMNLRNPNASYNFLVYWGYDEGFYLEANKIPESKYFAQVNATLPDYDSYSLENIRENTYTYLISMNNELLVPGYTEVYHVEGVYDKKVRVYRLYQKNA